MMTPPSASIGYSAGALALYATALLYVGTGTTLRRFQALDLKGEKYRWLHRFAIAGLGFHLLDASTQLWQGGNLQMGLFIMLSLANAVTLVCALTLAQWRPSLRPLTPLLLITAFITIPASHLVASKSNPKLSLSIGETAHILISITAWAILALAWLQSLLAGAQAKALKHHRTNRWIEKMPPLQATERILFELLTTGWGLLTLSMISGFLAFEDLMAQHLVHKTFFTALSWLLLTSVLIRHWKTGSRSKGVVRVARWSIVLMLIGYLGTKIAVELIFK